MEETRCVGIILSILCIRKKKRDRKGEEKAGNVARNCRRNGVRGVNSNFLKYVPSPTHVNVFQPFTETNYVTKFICVQIFVMFDACSADTHVKVLTLHIWSDMALVGYFSFCHRTCNLIYLSLQPSLKLHACLLALDCQNK